MKFLSDKNHILWLLMLIAVVVVIVIYRIGFSGTGSKEKAATSLDNSPQQDAGIKENSVETDSSANPSESESQFSNSTDLRQELPKESRYRSKNPLYFRVVFGKEGNSSMLGVVDESAGTGTGYDVAYVDENMNGDLTDEAAKKFSRYELGSRAGQLNPQFKFTGPFKGEQKAKYNLYLYSLTRGNYNRRTGNDYSFHWTLDTGGWNYFFINGKMKFFSNADNAMKSNPIRLGGQCQWNISSGMKSGKSVISAGLKDENGCTLRILSGAGERKSPRLTLIQDGKVIREEKMKFG